MKKYDALVLKIPKQQRWIVEDKFTIILNIINKRRFKRGEYKFITEEDLKRSIIQYMGKNHIQDLLEGMKAYRKYVEGELK